MVLFESSPAEVYSHLYGACPLLVLSAREARSWIQLLLPSDLAPPSVNFLKLAERPGLESHFWVMVLGVECSFRCSVGHKAAMGLEAHLAVGQTSEPWAGRQAGGRRAPRASQNVQSGAPAPKLESH